MLRLRRRLLLRRLVGVLRRIALGEVLQELVERDIVLRLLRWLRLGRRRLGRGWLRRRRWRRGLGLRRLHLGRRRWRFGVAQNELGSLAEGALEIEPRGIEARRPM